MTWLFPRRLECYIQARYRSTKRRVRGAYSVVSPAVLARPCPLKRCLQLYRLSLERLVGYSTRELNGGEECCRGRREQPGRRVAPAGGVLERGDVRACFVTVSAERLLDRVRLCH